RRTLGQEAYPTQLIGGIVLHGGDIAEMKTGEGKTLSATFPACLNALTGKGVHIVTVNDYLAKRDAEWMGKLYEFLGFSVGSILKGMDSTEKREVYRRDIIYATNNEVGFDYLRDNMAVYRENLVQRELHYAIVDEVDSILIDEARTPLIISGTGSASTELYQTANYFVHRLQEGTDFEMDEKKKTINLTEDGIRRAEKYFNIENLSDIENTEINHHINQALRAVNLMKRDRDYVVQNGEVVIVDEFTGRLMTGRRYSDGLHQAIEAKENVKVAHESKTLATITFQNLFRMYEKLAGMTGTAKTEEDEFRTIYGLGVVEIPTNRPLRREDMNDIIYAREKAKFDAVVEDIAQTHTTGQPILVGTISVEKSEYLSALLKRKGIRHEVLNAKHHEREAQIIAQAGQLGAVTIATNMAGRGTDILLGGNPEYMAKNELMRNGMSDEMLAWATSFAASDDAEILAARAQFAELLAKYKKETDRAHDEVVKAGGLYIIGTERHESRRIDNQLRGRSGRQGDPGRSRFYISLEDDLMRLFGGERIKEIVGTLAGGEDIPLEVGLLTKQIENAQKRIERRNFEIRGNVLHYDDVMNKQRELIYAQRREVLMGKDISESIENMIEHVMHGLADLYCPEHIPEKEWDFAGLEAACRRYFLPAEESLFPNGRPGKKAIKGKLLEKALLAYRKKEEEFSALNLSMRNAERIILLRVVDNKWMTHIDDMDQLKQGIGLRAYGNVDPVVAFRKESFDVFDDMIAAIEEDTVRALYHLRIESRIERKAPVLKPQEHKINEEQVTVKKAKKVGKNDLCPCGSGKKYKYCCGRPGANH
ncbi:MAG: preprotein translocase subunit SecA, partial [Christensenellaceae bacterium]|nr:preprotein translocase subunit SecA [Christensenellaceae bacterium]